MSSSVDTNWYIPAFQLDRPQLKLSLYFQVLVPLVPLLISIAVTTYAFFIENIN